MFSAETLKEMQFSLLQLEDFSSVKKKFLSGEKTSFNSNVLKIASKPEMQRKLKAFYATGIDCIGCQISYYTCSEDTPHKKNKPYHERIFKAVIRPAPYNNELMELLPIK